MAELIPSYDWSLTPLGPRFHWPVSLSAIVDMILASKFAMCVLWGRDLTFVYNDAYAPFLAAKHPKSLGRPMSEVWPEIWADIGPLIERAMSGDAVSMTDMPLLLNRRGFVEETWWTFIFSPLRDETGIVRGLLNIATDTTAKVMNDRRLNARQEELVEAAERLKRLNADLETSAALRGREGVITWQVTPYLMSVIDLSTGRFDRVNRAWEAVLGFTADEMEARPFSDFLHPDDLAASAQAFESVQRGDPVISFENRYRTKQGEWRWLSWVAVPLEGKLYSTARNVTEERKQRAELAEATAALAQAQKMEAIGQLTGGVAHDFNNLLTVIRGSVEMLRQSTLADKRRHFYVDAIGDASDRAAKLTSQLLSFARRQTLTPEVFDVGQSLDLVASIIRTMCGSLVGLSIEKPDERLLVNADRSQFDTAIVNMSVNARDAMNGEGKLTIGVKKASGIPSMHSHSVVAGDYVAIAVHDTGAGITEENIGHIFEPFFTTKGAGEGTGLGLSQVIGFAKQSGGDVRVASTPGRGTTFTLYLPRSSDGLSAVTRPDEVRGPAPGQVCVLVVEDNESVGNFAISALKELGYETILCGNAEDALAYLKENPRKTRAIFSDVVMPGTSGLDLARIVGQRYPDMAIILTSGYSHVLAQNGHKGFDLLQKPYSIDQLARVLSRALARQTDSA